MFSLEVINAINARPNDYSAHGIDPIVSPSPNVRTLSEDGATRAHKLASDSEAHIVSDPTTREARAYADEYWRNRSALSVASAIVRESIEHAR